MCRARCTLQHRIHINRFRQKQPFTMLGGNPRARGHEARPCVRKYVQTWSLTSDGGFPILQIFPRQSGHTLRNVKLKPLFEIVVLVG